MRDTCLFCGAKALEKQRTVIVQSVFLRVGRTKVSDLYAGFHYPGICVWRLSGTIPEQEVVKSILDRFCAVQSSVAGLL